MSEFVEAREEADRYGYVPWWSAFKNYQPHLISSEIMIEGFLYDFEYHHDSELAAWVTLFGRLREMERPMRRWTSDEHSLTAAHLYFTNEDDAFLARMLLDG